MSDLTAMSDRGMFALSMAKANECMNQQAKVLREHEGFRTELRELIERVVTLETIINNISEGL